MIRLYFNLTNKCNENCEFCCMYSSTSKSTFLNFDKYKEIIDSYTDDFELQLEGGEPLLHTDLFLFMEYARSTGRCKKIIILSNGILLNKFLPRLVNFHKYYKIPMLLKISVNYWLYNRDKDCLNKLLDYHLATEFIEGFDIKLNVRLRNDNQDEWLREEIDNKRLTQISNIFYLQSYGKLSNDESYGKPIIVQTVDDWFIYSCDGTGFHQDLIARSEYEKNLS